MDERADPEGLLRGEVHRGRGLNFLIKRRVLVNSERNLLNFFSWGEWVQFALASATQNSGDSPPPPVIYADSDP